MRTLRLLILVLLVTILAVLPVAAAPAVVGPVQRGPFGNGEISNQPDDACEDIGDLSGVNLPSSYFAFKIDNDPVDGTYGEGSPKVVGWPSGNNGTITLDMKDGRKWLDFSTVGIRVYAVKIKGGTDSYVYSYTGMDGTMTGSDLRAPNNGSGNQPAISHAIFCVTSAVDYGDLPESESGLPSYSTTSGNNGPSHLITPNLRIGPDVDAEFDGQPNGNSTGDDTAGPDEDGVIIPPLEAGQSAQIQLSVFNQTGSDATLYGFIDWNGDGDFDDANESATTTVPNGTDGIASLNFVVPGNAQTGTPLGARFRLSTANGLGATGPAPDGEVEDYLVTVEDATAVDLVFFGATETEKGIHLSWETAAEIDNAGFNLYRASSSAGPYTQINDGLIAAQGNPDAGATYSFTDSQGAGTFYYQLEDVGTTGVTMRHGPVSTGAGQETANTMHRLFLPTLIGN